jgi:hypothetical protein
VFKQEKITIEGLIFRWAWCSMKITVKKAVIDEKSLGGDENEPR